MKISTRLLIAQVATVLVILGAYIAVSHAQRRAILGDDLARDARTLAQVLQLSSDEMLANGSTANLDRMLRSLLEREDVYAAMALDPAGSVLAGGATDPGCVWRHLPAPSAGPPRQQLEGRAACGAGVRWVALPLPAAGGSLVVALEQVALNRAVSAAFQRQLVLGLALLLAIALAIFAILRRTLSEPLARIMAGVRSLAEHGQAPDIRVDPSAGELARLADAFNEMSNQLDGKRRQLEEEIVERGALETRLQESEKFAMLGRLSGGLAHELGSPLSVIGMRAEALASAGDVPPSARQHANAITAEVRQLTEFIEGLLHIARRHGIVFKPVVLTDLVESLRGDLAARVEGENIALHVELPDEPVVVHGQEPMLRHALRNLLRNGFHAVRERGSDRSIHVRMEQSEFEVRILVEDNGPGIPADSLEQVFEPFFTTKEVGAGSGLGLPISRGIVEEHGGELRLENRPEGGARAILTLPLPAERADLTAASDSRLSSIPTATAYGR